MSTQPARPAPTLHQIRRTTPGRLVLEALRQHGACPFALRWIEKHLAAHPRCTAQGLWSACPVGDWFCWLTACIGDSNVMDDLWDLDAGACVAAGTGDENDLRSARAIRAAYESPWL